MCGCVCVGVWNKKSFQLFPLSFKWLIAGQRGTQQEIRDRKKPRNEKIFLKAAINVDFAEIFFRQNCQRHCNEQLKKCDQILYRNIFIILHLCLYSTCWHRRPNPDCQLTKKEGTKFREVRWGAQKWPVREGDPQNDQKGGDKLGYISKNLALPKMVHLMLSIRRSDLDPYSTHKVS